MNSKKNSGKNVDKNTEKPIEKNDEKQMNANTKLSTKIIDVISGIFVPVINIMMVAALLKGVLMVLLNTGILQQSDGTYRILNAMGDGFFHFLPIFLAYTSAVKLKADLFTSVLVGAALVYPDLTGLFAEGIGTDFLGLPIRPVTYPSSVIPIILAVGLLHFVEIPLEQYIPKVVKGFLKPMISLLIVVPITFLIFGPLGTVIGNVLANFYDMIYGFSPILAGVLFGFLWQPMVVFGIQWGLVPVILEHINTIGYDTMLPMLGAAVTAQAGAGLAVGILTKDKDFKPIAFSGAVSAILGVTEPILYAVTVPLKRPMLAACIAGAIGGGIVAAAGARAISFAFPSILTLVVYLGEGFWTFLFSLPLGLILGFLLGLLLRFDEKDIPTRKHLEEQ